MTNMNNAPLLPEPLRDALDRLSQRDEVLGALLIGSLAADAFTPASDYDLVVVVNGGEPLCYVGVTEIGGRFADIVFVAGHALAQIQALDAPVAHDHHLAPVLRWIGDGVIVLDRGCLRAAQEYARAHSLLAPLGGESAYRAWFGLNYNLGVIRRLLRSDDLRLAADDLAQLGPGVAPAQPAQVPAARPVPWLLPGLLLLGLVVVLV